MATAAAAAAAMAPPGCPVCSFLERYGPLLDLPELPFPELERVLQAPPPDGPERPAGSGPGALLLSALHRRPGSSRLGPPRMCPPPRTQLRRAGLLRPAPGVWGRPLGRAGSGGMVWVREGIIGLLLRGGGRPPHPISPLAAGEGERRLEEGL
ncbi:hypothetical protein P7K49_022379 [Saguinus oedipus]|uniref:Uncharacterized protein n=1 Tax=Saguinus oedipus TaxID=9490 RepID=A0ABQ9UW35_SAGOE|nr:hypothetical protein P7K49_022379 [Saguinus oedipus]